MALCGAIFFTSCAGHADDATGFDLRANILWQNDNERFGGFSGIKLDDDHENFTAISDKGTIWRGLLARNEAGEIVDVFTTDFAPIKDSQGAPLDARNIDAEGLARGEGEALYISFESNNRIMHHARWDEKGAFLPYNKAYADFGFNSGLETIALSPQGEIWAIPERSGVLTRPFPIFVLRDDEWIKLTGIERLPPYLVVDADFDDEGNFYVLERDFTYLGGFSSRLRKFSNIGEEMAIGETVFQSGYGAFGNLEGLDIWRDENGALRATMIADDNFSIFLTTNIVEMVIDDVKENAGEAAPAADTPSSKN